MHVVGGTDGKAERDGSAGGGVDRFGSGKAENVLLKAQLAFKTKSAGGFTG